MDVTATYQNASGRLHIAVVLPACTYTVSPTVVPIAAAGGTATVSVFATPLLANCGWTALSSDSLVTITSGASGTGNGTGCLLIVHALPIITACSTPSAAFLRLSTTRFAHVHARQARA